jgi:membrane protease YdiL (CAAX protease family)
LLLLIAVELGVFGIVFGTAWLLSRANRDQLLLRWRRGSAFVLLGIGYSVALRLLIAALVAAMVLVLVGTGSMNSKGVEDFFTKYRPAVENLVDVSALRKDPLYFILTSTVVSFILGGLREELWRSGFLAGMRTLWPVAFGSRFGQAIPVILAAVIFGFGHLSQGPVAVFLITALGLGLGVIMVAHRSIWPAVIAHGMFDATSMALLPWAMDHMRP